MAIVISGSSGFVGQALIQHLHCQVTGRDQGIVALCRRLPKAPIDGVEYQLIGNWNCDQLSATINAGDSIVHLAGRAHQGHKCPMEEAKLQEQSHLTLSKELANAAKSKRAKRFIYISSAKVFAENSDGNAQAFAQESDVRPADPYSKAKWKTEQWLESFCSLNQLELIILRPGLIYDRHAKGNIAKLQALINSGLPLPFAGLNKRRDMISLANLCHLIEHCIKCPPPTRHTFIAADDSPLSSRELILLLAKAEGKKARLFQLPKWLLQLLMRLPAFNQQWSKLSSEFALDSQQSKQQLNWQAPFTAEQSLLEHSFCAAKEAQQSPQQNSRDVVQ